MPRRIGSIKFDAPVCVVLLCGCRLIVSGTSVFEVSSFQCIWDSGHGVQRWVSFGPTINGYYVRCRTRGCHIARDYDTRHFMASQFAASHSRLHGHVVELFADDWAGRLIEPVFLGEDTPPF